MSIVADFSKAALAHVHQTIDGSVLGVHLGHGVSPARICLILINQQKMPVNKKR
jgi:hypothetical protein